MRAESAVLWVAIVIACLAFWAFVAWLVLDVILRTVVSL